MLPDFFVGASAENVRAVAGQREDVAVKPGNFIGFFWGVFLPEMDFFVAPGADDSFAIRAEKNIKDRFVVTEVGVLHLSRAGIENTRRLVPAGRGDPGAVRAPCEREHPVGMLLDESFLRAAVDMEDPDGVIGAAGGESRAVRAERHSELHVGRGDESFDFLAGARMEEFDFADFSRSPAGRREQCAIRIVSEMLGALGQVFDPAQKFSVCGVPEKKLMITAGDEFAAIGREGEGQHRERPWIDLGRQGMRFVRDKADERGGGIGRVEFCAFLNPTPDQGNLILRQRIVLLRHAIVGVLGDESEVQLAFFRIAGGEGGRFAVASFGHCGERVELEAALGFFWAVAGDAFFGQDRRDVISKTDRRSL